MRRRRPMRVSLPPRAWPPHDRAILDVVFRDDDIFDRGALAHLRPSSRTMITWSYGVWLQFLAERRPDLYSLPPGERVDPGAYKAYAMHLLAAGHARHTITNYLKALGRVLAAADGPHHLVPAAAAARLAIPRPRQAADLVTSDQLVDVGMRMMERAVHLPQPPGGPSRNAARLYRDGLIVACLAAVPLRRANLAALELGDSFILDRLGRRAHVSIAPEFTKSRSRVEAELPSFLFDHLDYYLADIRPRLCDVTHSRYLWPSAWGGHLAADRIYNIVTRATNDALGRPVSPHRFRHAAATTIALEAPEQIAMARDVLGHANLATTERRYIAARGVAFAKEVERILERFRRG